MLMRMQVFGNFFGILATVVSIAIFRNPVSLIGMAGYGVTCFGVVLYMREKYNVGANHGAGATSASKSKTPDEENDSIAA